MSCEYTISTKEQGLAVAGETAIQPILGRLGYQARGFLLACAHIL